MSLAVTVLIGLVLTVVLVIWPSVRVLNKAGRSGWWVILWFVPIVNVVMYWVFAFVQWPTVDEADPDVNAF